MAKKRWVDGELRVYSRWWVVFNPNEPYLKDKESILKWFWKTNPSKIHDALKFLKDFTKENKYKNIISFGSGLCHLEYLLWEYLSKNYDDVFMVASDVDKRVIDVASRLFPEINCLEYNYYKHNFVDDIKNRFDMDYDLCFMIDSTYSMNDKTFIKFFKSLHDNGISTIVDFCGGIITHNRYPGEYIYRMNNGLKYIISGKLPNPENYIPVGPYGYGRTRDNLRSLYNSSGYDIIAEPVVKGLKYVVVLKSKNNGI